MKTVSRNVLNRELFRSYSKLGLYDLVAPDIGSWRSVSVMMRRYGEDAGLEAAQRADAMLEKGDMDGCRVWQRIVKAIEELAPNEPTGRYH